MFTKFIKLFVCSLGLPIMFAPAAFSSDGIVTEAGKHLTIEYRIEEAPVDGPTTAVTSALICGTGAKKVSSAVLWMPHHGHGSVPTRITSTSNGQCVRVDDVVFVMEGHWEIRLSFSDGDKGVFTAVVSGND